jgi:hypothetical protein
MTTEQNVQLEGCESLEGFADEVSRSDAVDLGQLDPLTHLVVETQNTRYEIFVLDPKERKVLVRGGKYFVEPVEACLNGSSFGGGFVKLGAIGVGMRMEIHAGGRRIITSRVRSIRKLDEAALPKAS